MARDAELKAKITADDQASKVFDKVADKADDLESHPVEMELDAEVSGVLSALDQVAAEAKQTAEAAEALGRALGPELAGKADPGAIVGDLQRMGLTLDQIKGNADELGAKMRELSESDVGGKLGSSLGTTRGKMDELRGSADQSRSVLANLAGNSVQDLGSLGGVAGGAGMALGQLAEYATEGNISLRGLAGVAGPMALVSVAIMGIQAGMESMAKVKAFEKEQVKSWTEAIQEGEDAVTVLADRLREAGAVKLEQEGLFGNDWFGRIIDANNAIDNLGLTYDEFAAIVGQGQGAIDSWAAEQAAAGADALSLQQATEAMNQELSASKTAAHDAEQGLRLTERSVRAADQAMAEFVLAADPVKLMPQDFDKVAESLARVHENGVATQEGTDALNRIIAATGMTADEVFTAAQGLLDDTADAAGEAAEAQQEMADAVDEAGVAMLDAAANSEAFSEALKRVNANSSLDFGQMAQDTVASFDSVKESLDGIEHKSKIDWSNFDITPDEYSELKGMPDTLAAVTDAVSGMRGSIQTELQAAFDSGGIDAYTEKATFFRDQVIDQFPAKFAAMGASTEEAAAQTQALVADLGLLPEDVEIMIQLTREEEARNALDAFSSVIAGMPTDVQVAINTAIAEGDIEGALAILNDQLIHAGHDPIVLPIDAEPAPAEDAVAGFVDDTEGENPVIPVDANPRDAERGVSGFVDDTEAEKPVVGINSNVQEAVREMLTIRLLAALLSPTVNIFGDASQAIATLNAVQRLEPRVGVEAYLRDYPTNAEIAARIGVIRVPVDAYLRSEPRITGLR